MRRYASGVWTEGGKRQTILERRLNTAPYRKDSVVVRASKQTLERTGTKDFSTAIVRRRSPSDEEPLRWRLVNNYGRAKKNRIEFGWEEGENAESIVSICFEFLCWIAKKKCSEQDFDRIVPFVRYGGIASIYRRPVRKRCLDYLVKSRCRSSLL